MKRWHMQPVVKTVANTGSVAPVERARRSESSCISLRPGLLWGRKPTGWLCPVLARSSRCSALGRLRPTSMPWPSGGGSVRVTRW